jgi:hypothetical protein
MALALLTNSVLDIGFGIAYWTINKTCSGIYNLGYYIFSKDEGEDEDNQVKINNENIILMDEIGKLRDEIKDLKESINS